MQNKLNVKDLINIGLFTILMFLFIFIGGMIGFIPILMPIVPFVAGFLTGPVDMLFASKVKKRGMLVINQFIIALVFVAMGHGIWTILFALIGALIGEIFISRDNYSKIKNARLAFSLMLMISFFGNWVPLFFARDQYIEQLLQTGYGEEYTQKLNSILPFWSIIPIMLLGFLGVYLGSTLGIKLLKKHFVRAKLIEV